MNLKSAVCATVSQNGTQQAYFRNIPLDGIKKYFRTLFWLL